MEKEKEQIVQLKEGSGKAFKTLYDAYAPNLYGFVYDLTRSSYLANEIVQESFIKIWEKREDIRVDLSFKSYLFMIAKNHIINSFRKQLILDDLTAYEHLQINLDTMENDTEKQLELKELRSYIEKLKSYLTPRQREIFELSKEQGMSNQEIAEMLGISNQSVKNQLYLSLQTLKAYFDKKTWLMLPLLYFFICQK